MLCGADFADLGKRWRCVAFRVEFACKTAQKSRVGFHGAASCPASLHAPAAPAASCPASPPTPAAPVVSLAPRQLACRAPAALAASRRDPHRSGRAPAAPVALPSFRPRPGSLRAALPSLSPLSPLPARRLSFAFLPVLRKRG